MPPWKYTAAGHLIRRARGEAELTQVELARLAGIAPGRLSDYERGKLDPSVAMLLRILGAAGMSLRLVHGDEGDVIDAGRNGRALEDVLSFSDALGAD